MRTTLFVTTLFSLGALFGIRSTEAADAYLESPFQNSYESGIGLIRGWVCQAELVEIIIDGSYRLEAAYGTSRPDTSTVCGHDHTGFGLVFNWNQLGDGRHRLQASADNVDFADITFNITTLGEEYRRNIQYDVTTQNFPGTGQQAVLHWSEPHQNFVVSSATLIPSGDTVAIGYPRDGGSVAATSEVEGTYGADVDEDIWVIVWPAEAPDRGWPQSDNAAAGAPATKSTGTWRVTSSFGGIPQNYDIAVYTATSAASNYLGGLLKQWYRMDNYPGMLRSALPNGLAEEQRIRVYKAAP